MNTVSLDRQKALAQWVSQATGIHSVGVKIRLRGNDLHIICEAPACPERWKTLSDLLRALQQTDLEALKSNDQPAVYQVFVYGRRKEEQRPQWCHRVFLNQLDKHILEVDQALLDNRTNITPSSGAIIISNESLARRGEAAAIARYLSETLSTLGVAVKVKVKKQKSSENGEVNKQRLWIFCQSYYTPDPSLIAEPVAQKLRNLNLSDYQDAVIASGVVGENTHDWLLRIDLTPPEVMLKEWARWGDIEAITRLVTAWLNRGKISVKASVKESTLHLFCTPINRSLSSEVPDKDFCLEAIVPQLEILAPQGISAATIYGQKTFQAEPTWIDWISLPAADHPALNIPTLELAKSGDESALLFLLERLLNPDIDSRLQTGGIRVMLIAKEDLLHVMCDAPICPTRKKVANKVIEFIRQLNIQDVTGARVYGRRAGNKKPFWQFGIDFQPRQSTIPEAPPEFAANEAYVQELLPPPESESVLRPDLTIEEVQSFIGTLTQKWGTTLRKFLLSTQLFTEKDSRPQASTDTQKVLLAGIWGAIGILLSLQLDWALGKIITDHNKAKESDITPVLSEETAVAANPIKGKPNSGNGKAFNPNGFTQTGKPVVREQQKATSTAILLAARSQMPTFNSRQLDEQLALYKQRLAKNGSPPDVLIVGSSRALRGVDPVALSKALASEGYGNLDVFNFGINGATVQVVELLVRNILKASELPKIIIWADGVRAFNSGRTDQTFETIAASEGYLQVMEASEKNDRNSGTVKQRQDRKNDNPKGVARSEQNVYQAFNKRLNRSIATLSMTYPQREEFKGLLNQQFKKLPAINHFSSTKGKDTAVPAVDFDGFLALSVRFDPQTYYQNHPKVSGSYDKDYDKFQLMGEQDIALQRMLKYTSSRKIPVVFVNMPLTATYLDPTRTEYEEDFQQYILKIAKVNNNFIFRDLTDLWPQRNDYFSDPSHLNRYGAYKVSKKLAIDPMIPWTRK